MSPSPVGAILFSSYLIKNVLTSYIQIILIDCQILLNSEIYWEIDFYQINFQRNSLLF